MKSKSLAITALALAMSGALAGSTLAKDEPKSNNGNSQSAAMKALAARQAALEAAAKEAAAKEAAAKKAKEEADAREAAARKAERERILQKTMRYDPFTYRPGMSQYEVHKMIAMRMKQRHEKMRSPGKPPESPDDHDHGHGNDDKDHGPHDDHDNGNHKGQGRR
jgi:hypothetical protein